MCCAVEIRSCKDKDSSSVRGGILFLVFSLAVKPHPLFTSFPWGSVIKEENYVTRGSSCKWERENCRVRVHMMTSLTKVSKSFHTSILCNRIYFFLNLSNLWACSRDTTVNRSLWHLDLLIPFFFFIFELPSIGQGVKINRQGDGKWKER